MMQASKGAADSAEKTVRDIRRAIRRYHSAEEKTPIALEKYYLPGQLRQSIGEVVEYYNNRRTTRAWTT